MRGSDRRTGAQFPYVDIEAWERRDHPPRTNRALAGTASRMAAKAQGIDAPDPDGVRIVFFEPAGFPETRLLSAVRCKWSAGEVLTHRAA